MDYYNAVRAFTRVVEKGSFVSAPASLNMPRDTVTKLVQMLEAHLRTKLLVRTTRQVFLTNDGVACYERISRVVVEWQEVESELAHAQTRPRERLKVDMAPRVLPCGCFRPCPRFINVTRTCNWTLA